MNEPLLETPAILTDDVAETPRSTNAGRLVVDKNRPALRQRVSGGTFHGVGLGTVPTAVENELA